MAKVRDTVTRILQLDADNIRALAIVTFLKRADATTSGDASAAKEAGLYGERGLNGLARWLKPEGLSDADFGKLNNQMAEIFYGAVGFSARVRLVPGVSSIGLSRSTRSFGPGKSASTAVSRPSFREASRNCWMRR